MNRACIAALLEVFGIFAAGQLVLGFLISTFGIPLKNPLPSFKADISGEQLVSASRDLFFLLTLQYLAYFILVIPINWWHRRTKPKAYGLTRAGYSFKFLVLAGLGVVALAAILSTVVSLIDAVYDIGKTVSWRQAIFDTSWRRWEFWFFMGVVSFGFVAFIEELFFRGYCQRRLAEDWGDGPAIVGTTFLFVFTHSQYLILNLYNVSLIISLIILSLGFGIVFAWTRSLVPSVIAHGIINTPMSPLWQGIFLGLLMIAACFTAPKGMQVVKLIFAGTSKLLCFLLAIAGVSWALFSNRYEHGGMIALGMVLIAVVLEILEKRSK